MTEDVAPAEAMVPVAPPPNVYAAHTSISFNPSEFILGIGHTRLVMATTNGLTTPSQVTEWLMSISLSPTTAKMLSVALASGVDSYEENFGIIPIAPGFNVKLDPQKS